MAAVATPPAGVIAPPVVAKSAVAKPAVAPPATGAPVKNELNILKVGVFGSLKKGENWQEAESIPPKEPDFKLGNFHAAMNRPPGKEVYRNLEYTNYDVGAAERKDFKDVSGSQIVTIDQVPITKQGRFYGRTQTDPAKTHASFQTALYTFRKKQFTEKLAKKKAANKAALNARQTQITTGTQSELDEMTRVYTAKKTELQRELDKKFNEHKNKLLANKEKVADKQYDKAPHLLLTNDLQKAGQNVIDGLLKPRETRRRHRFMHLLVKPGDAVVPAAAADVVDTRTPETIALAAAQARAAASEAALLKLAGAGAPVPGAGAAGAPAPVAGATLLTPLKRPQPRPASGSSGALPLPPSPGPPSTPPRGTSGGGSRKRKTKRKHRRSSK